MPILKMKPTARFCSGLLLIGCSLVCAQNPPAYSVTDLGVAPGMTISSATSLSSSGAVAGFSASSANWFAHGAGSDIGFLYANGATTVLANPPGPITVPFAVNSSGTVIGLSVNSQAAGGFVWANGHFETLSGLSLQASAVPTAINDAGQIAYSTYSGGSGVSYNLFLWTAGTNVTVSSGQGIATATGLASGGTIAGWVSTAGSQAIVSPFVWTGGALQKQTLPSGFSQGIATSINDQGVLAGAVFAGRAPTISVAAAMYKDGAGTVLGYLPNLASSFATSINHAGDIVGVAGTQFNPEVTNTFSAPFPFWPFTLIAGPTPDLRAFLYHARAMYDLNSLIPSGSGWTLSYATGINDAGQIAGTGFHNGQQRAFLLTPMATGPVIGGIAGAGLSVPAVTTLSSNGLFTIFGSNFAPSGTVGRASAPGGLLSTNVAQTCVQVGGQFAPLLYISPTQINAQVPSVASSATVPVSVIANCGATNAMASPPFMAKLAAASPEFLYFVSNANGQDPVAAVDNNSGAFIGAPGLLAGAVFTPAKPGEIVSIFGVGFGQTNPPQTPGTLATAAAAVPNAAVTLNGNSITAYYVGVTPGFAGLYQVSIAIPAGLSPGPYPIQVTIGGVSSPPGAFLQIGP
jgi:uncharacterized protein (TIGR03437 family)